MLRSVLAAILVTSSFMFAVGCKTTGSGGREEGAEVKSLDNSFGAQPIAGDPNRDWVACCDYPQTAQPAEPALRAYCTRGVPERVPFSKIQSSSLADVCTAVNGPTGPQAPLAAGSYQTTLRHPEIEDRCNLAVTPIVNPNGNLLERLQLAAAPSPTRGNCQGRYVANCSGAPGALTCSGDDFTLSEFRPHAFSRKISATGYLTYVNTTLGADLTSEPATGVQAVLRAGNYYFQADGRFVQAQNELCGGVVRVYYDRGRELSHLTFQEFGGYDRGCDQVIYAFACARGTSGVECVADLGTGNNGARRRRTMRNLTPDSFEMVGANGAVGRLMRAGN